MRRGTELPVSTLRPGAHFDATPHSGPWRSAVHFILEVNTWRTLTSIFSGKLLHSRQAFPGPSGQRFLVTRLRWSGLTRIGQATGRAAQEGNHDERPQHGLELDLKARLEES